MPVEFTCDGCNRRLRAPDVKAGKRVNCPTCGKDLQIPVMSTSSPLSIPDAGSATTNPLDKLAAAIPTAAEAAAGFNLSKPASEKIPELAKPYTPKPTAANHSDIGLADEPTKPAPATPTFNSNSSSGSTSSSGIGNSLKPKANAWRGGETAPATPGNPPKPAMPGGPPKVTLPGPTPKPAKPSMPVMPTQPAQPTPQLSLPMAGAIPMASPVPSAPTAPLAPVNPLDDIFKDLPQLAPLSAPVNTTANTGGRQIMFPGLSPVATVDPFASQGAALPQTSAPRWDQIASSANVASSNPYAAPSMGASSGFRRRGDIESVRTIVMVPGVFLLISYILLMIYAIFNMFVVALMLLGAASTSPDDPEGTGRLVGTVIGMIIGAMIPFAIALAGLVGSIKMIRIRSWGTALTASILGLCTCLPVGIWGIIVLSLENVRTAFEENDRRHGR